MADAVAIARLTWHLARGGKLSERQAGQVYANLMLGDWNGLTNKQQDQYIRRAKSALNSISGRTGVPICPIASKLGVVWVPYGCDLENSP